MADRYQPYDKDQSRTLSRAGSPTPSSKSTKSILGQSIQSIGKKTKSGLAGALAAVKHKNLGELYWVAAENEPSNSKEEGGFKTADQVVPTSQPEADGEDMETGEVPTPTVAEIRTSLFPDEDELSDEEEEVDSTPQAPKLSTPPKNLAALQDLDTTPRSPSIAKLTEAKQYALKVKEGRLEPLPDPFISSQPANQAQFIQNIEVSKSITKQAPNNGMDAEQSSPIQAFDTYTLSDDQLKAVLTTFMLE